MRKGTRTTLLAIAAALTSVSVSPQQKSAPPTNLDLATYDVKREVTLLGTVQSFTPAAQTPPLGAHLTLQTAAGIIDVHLGDSRFLAANQFQINTGDALRIVGENLTSDTRTQFVARLIQNGAQVLALRTIRGIPFSYMIPRNATSANAHTGVL